MEKEQNKITFEEYGLEFTEEDFKNVDKETLIKCRDKIDKFLEKMEKGEK